MFFLLGSGLGRGILLGSVLGSRALKGRSGGELSLSLARARRFILRLRVRVSCMLREPCVLRGILREMRYVAH